MDFQYYPTPKSLGEKAWAKFKNKDFSRVLEPSAGGAHLLDAAPRSRYTYSAMGADVIEIDITKHETLKSKGHRIVGFDFLQFQSGAQYSHIIANPPFAEGARHALHAWDILYDGELVVILNAETVRNPFSMDRQRLVKLIKEHGSVEFVQDAFQRSENADVQREANVEVAIVHLIKVADESELMAGLAEDLLAKMGVDPQDPLFAAQKPDIGEGNLMLPKSFIENSVIAFKAAVIAMKDSIASQARFANYRQRLGRTIGEMDGGKGGPGGTGATWVREEMAKSYDDLKERAWSGVLRSTEVSDKLSSKAQKRLESEFNRIKQMEFSLPNIYGFLQGLSESGWEIQIDMMCDIFDLVTRYHSDNAVFYKGWKSNDRHRTCGYRMKTTRFIIPGFRKDGYSSSFNYDGMRMLGDIDKVFALLDGKAQPEISLQTVFLSHYSELCNGRRIPSSYFEVRYYPGIGTIHFFAVRKDLVERMNRLVGQHRQWLPPDTEKVNKGFMEQYEKAEKFDAELRKEFSAEAAKQDVGHYRSVNLCNLMHRRDDERYSRDEEYSRISAEIMDKALDNVLERHGIDVTTLLTVEPEPVIPSLPAPSLYMAPSVADSSVLDQVSSAVVGEQLDLLAA